MVPSGAAASGKCIWFSELLYGVQHLFSVGCHGLLLLSASADGIWQVQTQFQQGLRCLQRVNE